MSDLAATNASHATTTSQQSETKFRESIENWLNDVQDESGTEVKALIEDLKAKILGPTSTKGLPVAETFLLHFRFWHVMHTSLRPLVKRFLLDPVKYYHKDSERIDRYMSALNEAADVLYKFEGREDTAEGSKPTNPEVKLAIDYFIENVVRAESKQIKEDLGVFAGKAIE